MEEKKKKSFWMELLPYIIIVVVVILIRSFLVTPIIVDGNSMNPTLNDNEMMLLWKQGNINRFDIVVIDIPNDHLIKRVIALPKETIKCEDHVIYVNDEALDSSYGSGVTEDFPSITLGDDEYFVLGDNRENSTDSRVIGPIQKSQIKGKTNFIIFPFTKFGKVE